MLWRAFGAVSRKRVALVRCSAGRSTNVATGRARVFRNRDVTPEVLIASACLPTMFQAIKLDGEAYWDGGYSGNPTITPLVRETASQDTIIIQINPIERKGVPRAASDI